MKIDLDYEEQNGISFEALKTGDVFTVTFFSDGSYCPGPYMKCTGVANCVNLNGAYTFKWERSFGKHSYFLKKLDVKLVLNA